MLITIGAIGMAACGLLGYLLPQVRHVETIESDHLEPQVEATTVS